MDQGIAGAVCPSVRPSVRPSICLSVLPHVKSERIEDSVTKFDTHDYLDVNETLCRKRRRSLSQCWKTGG